MGVSRLVFAWVAAVLLVGIAGWTQRRRGTIPNQLTLPAIAVGPIVQLVLGAELQTVVVSLGVSLTLGLYAFRRGLGAGGAVKLYWALCAVTGRDVTLVTSALAAVLLALLSLDERRRARVAAAAGRELEPRDEVDAPPILAAMLLPGLALATWEAFVTP